MAVRYAIPKPTEPLLDQFGKLSAPWYNYLRTRFGDAAAEEIIASIETQIADLLARVEELEEGGSAQILGPGSVIVTGTLSDGVVQLTLDGDERRPLPVSFYSTDEARDKGWNLLYPNWVPNPYADYPVDENGDYLIDENGNFLTAQDGFPIPLEYGGTGGDYSNVAANLAFASPDGSAGEPVFRALVADDIPDHNSVNGLQGGQLNEYYHLTAAEHTAAQGLASVAPTGGIFASNLQYNVTPFQIVATTADGADTSRAALSGGGAIGATRGGYVICFGNESATNPGQAQVISGNGADIVFSGGTLRSSLDNTYDFGTSSMRYANGYVRALRPGAGAVIWTSGTGTPEGVVVAPVGSLFTRTDGGAGTTLYCKESGAGNTGWVAK